jgi:hypothetical protein
MAQISGVRYSRGNRKVGVDTIIVNITSAHKCRSLWKNWQDSDGNWLPGTPEWAKKKENLCQVPERTCYAWKSENLYKNHTNPVTGKLITGCLHNRDDQTRIWDVLSPEEYASALKNIIAKENRSASKQYKINGKQVPIRFIRFQESGDFRDQADVQKMSRIASLLPSGVKAYTYTARKDLNYSGLSPNLAINGSGFMKPGVDASFKVVDKAGYEACPKGRPSTFDCNECESQCKSPRCRGITGGGCQGCSLCKSGGGKVIREILQQAGKKAMTELRRGKVNGDEHGGVESMMSDASEILESGAASTRKKTKATKKSAHKTIPSGFGGLR